MITKFKIGDVTYPYLADRSDIGDYEKQVVLIQSISGDYFLAIIDSAGVYKLLEEVASDEVEVILS
jgi:hypothetical protein